MSFVQPCRIAVSDRAENEGVKVFLSLKNQCGKRLLKKSFPFALQPKSTSRSPDQRSLLRFAMCFFCFRYFVSGFSESVLGNSIVDNTPHKHYAALSRLFCAGQRLNQVHQKPQQHNCIIAAGFSVTVAVGIFFGRFTQADGSGNRLVQQNRV